MPFSFFSGPDGDPWPTPSYLPQWLSGIRGNGFCEKPFSKVSELPQTWQKRLDLLCYHFYFFTLPSRCFTSSLFSQSPLPAVSVGCIFGGWFGFFFFAFCVKQRDSLCSSCSVTSPGSSPHVLHWSDLLVIRCSAEVIAQPLTPCIPCCLDFKEVIIPRDLPLTFRSSFCHSPFTVSFLKELEVSGFFC